MTDCPNGELRDLLPDLLHDRLTPEARRSVEAHVGQCAPCQQELALLRDLRAAMAHAPTMDVARITAAIPPHRPAAERQRAGSLWRVAAAVTLLVGSAATFALMRREPRAAPPSAVIATARAPLPAASGTTNTPGAASARTTAVVADRVPSARRMRAPSGERRELALASSSTTELTDHELSALLRDIEAFDALPSVEVEGGPPPSPLSPALPRGRS